MFPTVCVNDNYGIDCVIEQWKVELLGNGVTFVKMYEVANMSSTNWLSIITVLILAVVI